jgi:hypothetical protein
LGVGISGDTIAAGDFTFDDIAQHVLAVIEE